MSHLTHLKTQIKDLLSLEIALSDLGIQFTRQTKSGVNKEDFPTMFEYFIHSTDLKINPINIKSLNIDPTCDTTEIKSTPSDISTPFIFFKRNGEEYELVLDRSFWTKPFSVEKFIQVISERYAESAVRRETRRLGFEPIKTKKNIDGSQTLTFQRWKKS
jgi:hypothetical protein